MVAYSYAVYTANGATQNFSVPFPYINKADVHIKVNEVDYLDADISWTSDTIIHMAAAPANGAVVKVYRETDKEALSAIYSTPTVFDHRDINRVLTQLLYTTQEAWDIGITPLSDITSAITNLQTLVNAAAGSADAAQTKLTACLAALTAAQAAQLAAENAAAIAEEVTGLDFSTLLTKAGNLSGIADAATARSNIGAAAASDIVTEVVRYVSQTLTGPQKTQALANIGAYSAGGGTVSGTMSVTGTITSQAGGIANWGYSGDAAKSIYYFNQVGDKMLRYGVAGAYFDFSGAHVYSPAGRLLGTNDASQIVGSLRWVYGGSYSTISNAPQAAAPLGANVMLTGWSNDGTTLTVYGRYMQMQIAGTWYTVGAV